MEFFKPVYKIFLKWKRLPVSGMSKNRKVCYLNVVWAERPHSNEIVCAQVQREHLDSQSISEPPRTKGPPPPR